MSNQASAPLRVMNFWRDVEAFNIPTAPSARHAADQTKIKTLRRGVRLPWQRTVLAPTDKDGFVHMAYLGVADIKDLSRPLLEAVFPERDLSELKRQRVSSNGWLAASLSMTVAPSSAAIWPPVSLMVWKRYGQTGALENINLWFGRGPYRVWKSRLQGLAYKNSQSYRPELGIPGIQRLPHDLCWAQPETREQPINLVSAHEGTVLYLYTPHFPEGACSGPPLGRGHLPVRRHGSPSLPNPPAADGHQVDDQQGAAAGALVSARRVPFLTLPD